MGGRAVPLCAVDEQGAIVEAVEDQLSIIDHLEADLDAKLQSAQGLRQSILRHAFTGDQDRDYRNMGLLWDTVGLLASSSSPLDLAKRVTRQLRRALSASLVTSIVSPWRVRSILMGHHTSPR